MTSPYRAMIARMADELDHYRQLLMDDRREVHALATEARALLAQPGPEGLTDEKLLELMPQQFRDDLATVSRTAAHGAGPGITPGIFRVSLNTGALDYARAAIAADRARRPTPQPPADGEVGYALLEVRVLVDELCDAGKWIAAQRLTRAADLLERLVSPACYVLDPGTGAIASLEAADPGRIERLPLLAPVAQPVAVSERPWEKEAGWLDLDNECWWCPPDGTPYWSFANPQMVYGGWVLPFNALPLPQADGT